jgi:hypothetical protein
VSDETKAPLNRERLPCAHYSTRGARLARQARIDQTFQDNEMS